MVDWMRCPCDACADVRLDFAAYGRAVVLEKPGGAHERVTPDRWNYFEHSFAQVHERVE